MIFLVLVYAPGKNLGAYGDAGIITTNNKIFYDRIRNYRNLGSIKKFIHTTVGVNSRLDTIQAAILLRKLPLLNDYNNKRKKLQNIMTKKLKIEIFKNYYIQMIQFYHQYVILVKNRKKIIDILKKNKIEFGFLLLSFN